MRKIFNRIADTMSFVGKLLHKFFIPFMGIMWLVILAAGAMQHKSIGVAIDGEINGANFDGVTKGWYAYAFIVIFVCWLFN